MKSFKPKLFVLLMSISLLQAEETNTVINANSTLPDLVRYATEHNAGLQAAYHDWQARLLRIPQVTALPDPKLSFGHFIRSVETRVGPQQNRFGIAQAFPWFGKLKLRGDQVAQQAEANFQRLESARQMRGIFATKSPMRGTNTPICTVRLRSLMKTSVC